jgi:hypothetical protein
MTAVSRWLALEREMDGPALGRFCLDGVTGL